MAAAAAASADAAAMAAAGTVEQVDTFAADETIDTLLVTVTELGLFLLSFLPLHTVENCRCVSTAFKRLVDRNELWGTFIRRRWKGKLIPPFQTDARELYERASTRAPIPETFHARQVFWETEFCNSRNKITEGELCENTWVFCDGVQVCDFQKGPGSPPARTLTTAMHGVLPWALTHSGQLDIANFPRHSCERTTSWGWVIRNQHIFILSVARTTEELRESPASVWAAFEEARLLATEEYARPSNTVFDHLRAMMQMAADHGESSIVEDGSSKRQASSSDDGISTKRQRR